MITATRPPGLWRYVFPALLFLIGAAALGFQARRAYRKPVFRQFGPGGTVHELSACEAKEFFSPLRGTHPTVDEMCDVAEAECSQAKRTASLWGAGAGASGLVCAALLVLSVRNWKRRRAALSAPVNTAEPCG